MPSGPRPSGPTGMILVHGIGEQAPGDTLAKFLAGIERSFPSVKVELDPERSGRATLWDGDRSVRVYEAHWAPLLSKGFVENSFRTDALFEIGWFPLLNHTRGTHPPGEYRSLLVWGWTVVLVPVGVALHLALIGVNGLVRLFDPKGYADRRQRVEVARDTVTSGGPGGSPLRSFLASSRATAEIAAESPTRLDLILDTVVSDVTNYINSVAGAFPSDAPWELREAAQSIEGVFASTVADAVEDGCREIQIVAHSLGTVVAYRVLSRDGRALTEATEAAGPGRETAAGKSQETVGAGHRVRAGAPPVPITRLLTIGSPLEKIRFIWPSILERRASIPAIGPPERPVARADPSFEWHNFTGIFDLVSGNLTRFDLWNPVQNHRTPGLGGVASAHVTYESSPTFMNELGLGLFGRPAEAGERAQRRLANMLRTAAENLAVPLLFFLVTLAGVASALMTGWLGSWAFRLPLEMVGWIGPEGGAAFSRWMALLVAVMVALGALPSGRSRARQLHAAYFSGKES